MINKLFAKRRQRRATVKYQRGWDWAASCLLNGVPVAVVSGWAEYGVDWDGPNPFDRGVVAATRAFESIIKEVMA